jgi:hypothetical protein
MPAWITAADVAAVDAHAEGDRGTDDVDLVGGEGVLGAAAVVRVHAGVVVGGPVAERPRGGGESPRSRGD